MSIKVNTVARHPNQLLVTWQPPDTPNGLIIEYAVFCFRSEDGSKNGSRTPMPSSNLLEDSISNITVLGSEISATVGGLDPYTLYDCTVTAYTSIGEGDPSSYESGVTDQSSKFDKLLQVLLCFNSIHIAPQHQEVLPLIFSLSSLNQPQSCFPGCHQSLLMERSSHTQLPII